MAACKNQTFLAAAINHGFFQFVNIGKKLEGVKGRDFKMLQLLSTKMQFQYVLVTPEDGQWGNCHDNGHCNGIIGMLARHEADISISDVSYTAPRTKYVDFSYPYFLDEVTFVTKNNDANEEIDSKIFFVEPFQRQVWIFLTFLVVIFLSVKILEYFELLRTKIMSVQTMLQIILRQGIDLKRSDDKLSAVALILLVVTVGCTCKFYECRLTSEISLGPVSPPIDTISDMVAAIRTKEYVIITWEGTSYYEELVTSKLEYMKIFAQSILSRNFALPKTEEEAIRMAINGKFAQMISKSAIKRSLIKLNIPVETLHCGKENMFIDHIVVAARKHFPCKDDLDKWLSILICSGLIDKWHSEDMTLLNQSTSSTIEISSSSFIAMTDLKIMFVALMFGYLACFVTLLMEMIFKYWRARI